MDTGIIYVNIYIYIYIYILVSNGFKVPCSALQCRNHYKHVRTANVVPDTPYMSDLLKSNNLVKPKLTMR